MKVYEAVFDENAIEGVYALSVVDDPAMEDMFIALSDHPKEIQFSAVDNDKRLLLGAALIPNKKIYRNIDGNEFYMTFSEETIEKLAHAFLKNGNQGNSSLDHEVKLENMSVVETWIVDDPLKDKSNAYGKQYEKGTWVAMMKVDNDEIWDKAKSGEIRGFSIEALLGLTEIKFKTSNNMTKEDLKSFGEELFGNIKALFNTNQEEVKETEVVAEEVEATPQEDASEGIEALKSELENIMANFKKEVAEDVETLKAEFSKEKEALVKENESLKAELAKQPEVEEIKDVPQVSTVELTKQGQILELLRQNK